MGSEEKVRKVKEQMGLFEKILSYIPGYRGYKEKEIRRETDRLIRMEVANRLKRAKTEIRARLSNPMVLSRLTGDDMWLIDQLIYKLDRVTQRIDKAVAGYAGLFDAVKVREDRLDKVIEHDLMLIEKAEEILNKAKEIKSMRVGTDDWRNALMDLTSLVEEFDELIDKRTEILKSLEV